jgi:tetratricopeptide (TPR) repeat protein
MKNFFFALLLAVISICLSCRNNTPGTNEKSSVSDNELTALNEGIEKNEKDPILYLKRADYYTIHNRFNDALADVNKALIIDPNSAKGYSALSGIYVLMGKPQQALEALNKVISIDAGSTDAYVKKARLYLVMKDYENCASTVQKVFELDPYNADAYYLKGMALDENGEKSKAIDAFLQAVLNNPHYYDALMQLGYAYAESKPSMAIDYFTNAIKANPNSFEAHYNLGMIYQENNEPEKALNSYAAMLKLDPGNKLALYNSGYVNLVYLQKFKAGIDFFSKAISVDSLYVEAYYNRGYCYELSGDVLNARNDYEKVLAIKTNDPKAVQGLNRLEKIKGYR